MPTFSRSLLLIVLLARFASVVEGSVAERCAEAIARVRSYDVTFASDHLVYKNAFDKNKASSSENPATVVRTDRHRDVLAFGMGRRMERHVDRKEAHSIGVVDWKAAASRRKTVAIILSAPGKGYLDLFNPDCWGFFLADLLRDKSSKIVAVQEPPPREGLQGFEVTHLQMARPVRVWADPKHGYMPAILEKYVHDKIGKRIPLQRTTVTAFVDIGDGVWVPLRGIIADVRPTGPTAGMTSVGDAISVDQERSSWNAISSPELFLAGSLPEVNYTARTGWQNYYPPAILAGVKRGDELRRSMVRRAIERPISSARLIAIGVSVFLLLLTLGVFRWRVRRRREIVGA